MVKIDIVTGFLGSGKTTFIKKMLEYCQSKNEKLVIIENEFGQVGVDGELVKMNGIEVYEITNGCICCTLKNDFAQTLTSIIDNIKPDRIIFEPSGIFVPTEIIDMLNSASFSSKCELNTIIAVIDSINYLKQKHKYGFFFEKQIKSASTLVLSKSQYISSCDADMIVNNISKLLDNVPVHTLDWELIDNDYMELILSQDLAAVSSSRDINSQVTSNSTIKEVKASKKLVVKNHGFDSFGIRNISTINHDRLQYLLKQLSSNDYGDVIRAKGIINTTSGYVEFSYVNGNYNLNTINDTNPPITMASFIGKNINKILIESNWQ